MVKQFATPYYYGDPITEAEMIINKTTCFLLAFLSASPLIAQSATNPPVSKVFAVLQKTLETRTSVVGDEFTLTTVNDVVVDKYIVIPKGSRILGRVAGVIAKGKDEPKSVLAIRLDKAVTASGEDIALQAIIAAIAAPPSPLTSDATYEMMHSNEPKMIGSARGTANSGTLSSSSKANSNAAVATAEMKGRMDDRWLLNENSQGAAGYEDILISWHLALPPPLTVFTTKAKTLKLEAGTQMLLRMAEPRVPR